MTKYVHIAGLITIATSDGLRHEALQWRVGTVSKKKLRKRRGEVAEIILNDFWTDLEFDGNVLVNPNTVGTQGMTNPLSGNDPEYLSVGASMVQYASVEIAVITQEEFDSSSLTG